MNATALAAATLLGACLVLLVARSWLAVRVAKRQRLLAEKLARLRQAHGHSGHLVTVAQPVLGGDPLLEKLLAANARNLSGDAQLVWLVDEDDHVGLDVTARLRGGFPGARIVRCPPCPAGLNPKLFKLQQALDLAATELFAVLDDDTVVSRETLQTACDAIARAPDGERWQVDLFTGLPLGRSGAGVWSRLVTHFINNNAALTYLPLLNWWPPLSINGMFYVLRCERLRQLGGFAAVQQQLCDDYAVHRLVTDSGGRVRQGVAFQEVTVSVGNARHYFGLMRRWFVFANRLVRDQGLAQQLVLALLLGLPPVLWLAGTVCAVLSWWGLVVLVVAVVARGWVLRRVMERVYGGGTDEGKREEMNDGCADRSAAADWSFVATGGISLVAEWLQPVHWLSAVGARTIRWRGRRLAVRRDGRIAAPGDLTP